jgi:YqaJ-like viral recombinase domain
VSTVHINTAPTPNPEIIRFNPNDRRHFIGGSDARIIMGDDQDRLIRLWQEKRGEVEPEDLSDNLIVQLGTATEALNRAWYQRSTGQTITDVQKRVRHPMHKWMAATLDGMVEPAGAVFEAKFMLPWTFTEEAAAEKHMAQLQHNMWVVTARSSVLWRQMGRDQDLCRPALSAPPAHGRKEVLALCPERRAASPVQHRNAASEAGGRQGRRHGIVEPVGRVCGDVSAHQRSPHRA